jgi:hypothetical protein
MSDIEIRLTASSSRSGRSRGNPVAHVDGKGCGF